REGRRIHRRAEDDQAWGADRLSPRPAERPYRAVGQKRRLTIAHPGDHSIVLAGLVPAIYETRHMPRRFPWMPGTTACPRAPRSAGRWAGQDESGGMGHPNAADD